MIKTIVGNGRVLACLGLLSTGTLLPGCGPPDAGDPVTRARVPGVGVISGYVGRTDHVAPRLKVPSANNVPGRAVDLEQPIRRLYARRLDRVEGDPATVAAIKADVRKRLFLSDASYGCIKPPRAAGVVLAHVYAPPTLSLALAYLDERRRAELPQQCDRQKVRVDSWQGIEVDGRRAFVRATGRRNAAVGFATMRDRFQARLELTLTDAGWKIALHAERNVDRDD